MLWSVYVVNVLCFSEESTRDVIRRGKKERKKIRYRNKITQNVLLYSQHKVKKREIFACFLYPFQGRSCLSAKKKFIYLKKCWIEKSSIEK